MHNALNNIDKDGKKESNAALSLRLFALTSAAVLEALTQIN
jgi:hypothetical protein